MRRRDVLGSAAGTALWLAASPTAWAAPASASAPHPNSSAEADPYEETVRAAAMVWRKLPTSWQEGPFLANGRFGAQLYAGRTANTLKLMLSHSEVQDQRGQWRGGIGYSPLPIGPTRAAIRLPRHATAVITTKGTRPSPPREVPPLGTWTRWGLPR
ncbi:hypothetical protein ACFWDI_40025 [Streptomyces sp. NPDC060064]|uniref:hypothetical protein n=1 Tax=Streptomyces sp. NPDC060064 TaxID=3347049 RepID=UPI00369CA87F